jgi:hypothetical protein
MFTSGPFQMISWRLQFNFVKLTIWYVCYAVKNHGNSTNNIVKKVVITLEDLHRFAHCYKRGG